MNRTVLAYKFAQKLIDHGVYDQDELDELVHNNSLESLADELVDVLEKEISD